VEASTYAPSEALADVVLTYWSARWDLPDDAPHTTELVSDPTVNFVCEAGTGQAGSRVVGVWTRLWRRVLAGKGHVRGVKLRAGAVRAFVDAPAHELANRILPLASLFDDAAELERRVVETSDEAEAFGAFEDWLERHRRSTGREEVALAVSLVDRIQNDPELLSVERLAHSSGIGARSLQRLFRGHVGASPKFVIRRFRLQEAALRIEQNACPSFAELAAALGYTDQAHLARDFRNVVGKSPSEFAASVTR
jgi:AraC-like DNA-binding protein